MKYWLFPVMPWFGPELWKKMIEGGIAAQHYDEDIPLCKQNITMLRRMKKGDGIIAAFKKHRFAGYGTLVSGFYRGGKALNLPNRWGNLLGFYERFDVAWKAIPLENGKPFIDCHSLKIEVHHLKPLGHSQKERDIDPVKEMRPVCPNCHAMLHRREPPLDIGKLQAIWGKRNA